jgi:hypothetical protein
MIGIQHLPKVSQSKKHLSLGVATFHNKAICQSTLLATFDLGNQVSIWPFQWMIHFETVLLLYQIKKEMKEKNWVALIIINITSSKGSFTF